MEDSPFPSRIPLILLGSGISALLLSFALNVNPAGVAEPVLRTLATVQGTLFAIVFSIIILAVRLSANRYSPRIAELYSSDSAYLWTFIVFGGSIGTNLLGLYLLSATPTVLRFFMILGGILAVVAFLTLYQFVSYILQQTTPEGILQRIDEYLSPNLIIQQAEQAASRLAKPNPYLILVTVINSAIKEKDDTTAELGLQIVGRRTRDVLEFATEDDLEEDAPLTDAIQELCTNRLVGITHNALDNKLPEVAEETLASFKTIVSASLEYGAKHIARFALEGIFEITGTVNFDISADRVRRESIESGVKALQTLVDNEQWSILKNGIRIMGWRVSQSIMNRGEDAPRDTNYGTLFIRWVPSLLERTVNQLDVEVRDVHMNWSSGNLISDDDASNEEMILHGFFIAMAEMTSALLRHQIRTEDSLTRWQYVARGWLKCFEAIPEELASLRSTWLSTMLYIDYLSQNLLESQSHVFQTEIRRSVPGEFIDETIDKIREGTLQPRAPIDMIAGIMDPTEFSALTGPTSPPDIEADRGFEEWLNLQQGFRSRSETGGFGSLDDEFFDIDTEE